MISARHLLPALLTLAPWTAAQKPTDPVQQPGYPDTTDGLVQCIGDILAAVESRSDRAQPLIRSLVLPDHERWFKQVFRAEVATRGAKEYSRTLKEPGKFEAELRSMFEKLVKEERTKAAAIRLEKRGPNATGLQNSAFDAMVTPTVLYTVKLGKESPSGFSFWSLVHVDGSFRLLGKMSEALRDGAAASAPGDGVAAFQKFAEALAQGTADGARLALPDHADWFRARFEPKEAEALTTEYAVAREQMPQVLSAAIAKNLRDGKSQVSVQGFDKAIDPKANGLINAALQRMKLPTTLYLMRLTKPGEQAGTSYWSFVREGGEFRFVGKMAALRAGGKAASGDLVGDVLCSLPLEDAEKALQEKKLLTGSAVEYLKKEGLLK